MHPLVILVVAMLLASLWGAAAFHKWRDLEGFRRALSAYRLVPAPLLAPVSVIFPVIETGLAVAVLYPASQAVAGQVSACLLLLYALAMSVNLLRGNAAIDCGCHFGRRRTIGWPLVVRNLALAFVPLLPLMSSPAYAVQFQDILFAFLVAAFVLLALAIVAQLLSNQALQTSAAKQE